MELLGRKPFFSPSIAVVTAVDVRRELDKLAVRWKMKNPGRVENTADYDSSVPLMSSQGDDPDDQVSIYFTHAYTYMCIKLLL